MARGARFKAGTSAGDVVLDPLISPVVFSGAGVTLRKVDGMVHARGDVARASGSSTSYTDCVDDIPPGYLPLEDTSAPAAVFFATGAPALSYQFKVLTTGKFQVRMSGANANGMTVNTSWPAAAS